MIRYFILQFSNLPNKQYFFLLSILGIAILRILVGFNTEIIGQPYDTDLLVHLISVWHWRNYMDPLRPPFMSIFGAINSLAGIPYRITIELLYVAATLNFLSSLQFFLKRYLSIALCILAFLNPYTIFEFVEAQRDPLLLIEYLFLFGSINRLLSVKLHANFLYELDFWVYSLASASIIMTREGEELYIFVITASFFITYFYLLRDQFKKNFIAFLADKIFIKMVGGFIAPICLVLLISAGFYKSYYGIFNYRGLFPSYVGLLSALNKIESGNSQRYAPITEKSLKLAANTSPSFEKLSDILFDTNDEYIKTSKSHSSVDSGVNEMDSSRSLWIFNYILNKKFGANDTDKLNFLNSAKIELEQSMQSGNLPIKYFTLPYPFDPNIGNWYSCIPMGLMVVLSQLTFPTYDPNSIFSKEDFNPSNFDLNLNRRTGILSRQKEFANTYLSKAPYVYILALFVTLLISVFDYKHISCSRIGFATPLFIFLIFRISMSAIIYISVIPLTRYFVFLSPIYIPIMVVIFSYVGNLIIRQYRAFFR